MEVIRGLHNLCKRHHGCVLTIGNFDGVHVGHQVLLDKLKKIADRHHLPTCVMTFEPHPYEFFGVDVKPRLTRLREKIAALKAHGIDRVFVIRFNSAFATIPAEQFVKNILVNRLGVKAMLVGDDFRFGAKRQGDIALLKKLGNEYHFEIESMSTLLLDGVRISSTRVREALQNGDMKRAKKLLGRSYTMSGHVAHGNKRGRIIGFPTANIFLHRKVVPIHGVFCVIVSGLSEGEIYGVANIGNRPTVGGTKSILEVHLFNFDREIYGQHVIVSFEHKLRDEKKYDSFELLKEQIMQDADNAKRYFSQVFVEE